MSKGIVGIEDARGYWEMCGYTPLSVILDRTIEVWDTEVGLSILTNHEYKGFRGGDLDSMFYIFERHIRDYVFKQGSVVELKELCSKDFDLLKSMGVDGIVGFLVHYMVDGMSYIRYNDKNFDEYTYMMGKNDIKNDVLKRCHRRVSKVSLMVNDVKVEKLAEGLGIDEDTLIDILYQESVDALHFYLGDGDYVDSAKVRLGNALKNNR